MGGHAMANTIVTPPPAHTAERWCWDLVSGDELARKLDPPAPPDPGASSSWEAAPPPRRIAGPGRPAELRPAARSPRTPRPEALREPAVRARLLHAFLHHELQAAELFAWAILAFPATPHVFRAGLLWLSGEELRHLRLYRRHMERLGLRVGEVPVRDWFWERVGTARSAVAFVALQGLGLEGANLDHSARFASWFRAAGDEEGARILERVAEDEIAHVAFARHWLEELSGEPLDYDRWRAALHRPLTPAVLKGRPLNRDARRRAGLDEAFLDRLEAEPPATSRSPA